jgi:GAF domain-containing protein
MRSAAFLALFSSVLQNEHALRADSEQQADQNAQLLEALRGRQVLLERLVQLQRGIVDRLPLHEVLEAVVEGACELLDCPVGVMWIADPDDPDHAAAVALMGEARHHGSWRRRKATDAGLGGRAMRQRTLVVADAVTGIDSGAESEDFPIEAATAAMAAPVYERSRVVGSLGVASAEPGREYGPRDQQILISFAEHASLALKHARALEEALHEALHDPLTGLPNRSLFLDRMRHALARAERDSEPVAVLFCDLVGF